MSGRQLGTLVVVVLKAKNLPNKRRIGKQDPYCVLKVDGQTRRTKADKRGGQHPEWDDELRFPLYESVEEELARTAAEKGAPPPPPKDGTAKPKKPAKRSLMVACYDDDSKEPPLVGETTIDLTEALSKGEIDEWYTLMNKQKYCGEVYLEMTYWSEEEPPPKQQAPQQSALHPQYGGRGTFVPASEGPPPLHIGGFSAPSAGGRLSAGGGGRPSLGPRHSSGPSDQAIPDSLRPSSSLANLDLYIPPYASARPASAHPDGSRYGASLAYGGPSYLQGDGMDEFGVPRRRDSFPPHPRQSSYGSVAPSTISSYPNNPYPGDNLSSSFSSMTIGPGTNGYGPGPPGYPSYQQPPLPQPTPGPYAGYPQASGFGGPQSQQPYVPPPSSMGFRPPVQSSGFQPTNSAPTPAPYFPAPSATPTPYQQYPSYGGATPVPQPQPQLYPAQQQQQQQQPIYPHPPPTPVHHASYPPPGQYQPQQQQPQFAPAPTPIPQQQGYQPQQSPYYGGLTPPHNGAPLPPGPSQSAPPQPQQQPIFQQQSYMAPAPSTSAPPQTYFAPPPASQAAFNPPPPPPPLHGGRHSLSPSSHTIRPLPTPGQQQGPAHAISNPLPAPPPLLAPQYNLNIPDNSSSALRRSNSFPPPVASFNPLPMPPPGRAPPPPPPFIPPPPPPPVSQWR